MLSTSWPTHGMLSSWPTFSFFLSLCFCRQYSSGCFCLQYFLSCCLFVFVSNTLQVGAEVKHPQPNLTKKEKRKKKKKKKKEPNKVSRKGPFGLAHYKRIHSCTLIVIYAYIICCVSILCRESNK